jgi:hypothetical protein
MLIFLAVLLGLTAHRVIKHITTPKRIRVCLNLTQERNRILFARRQWLKDHGQ